MVIWKIGTNETKLFYKNPDNKISVTLSGEIVIKYVNEDDVNIYR